MAIIEIEGLSKSFKSGSKVVNAVNYIDLKIEKGEIFGFLGPNGAGKTTTMRMLTTLMEPNSGKAILAGYDLLSQPEKVRTKIGYVSQSGGLDGNSTTRENLVLQARLYDMSENQANLRVNELIKAFNLTEFADSFVCKLSGGQKRRIDLALGLVHKPEILFLDEPTASLDPHSRAIVWKELQNIRQNGTTIFITTHYLDEADALCDRIAIINKGIIVALGTPKDLKKQIAGDVITLGLNNDTITKAYELLHNHAFINEINKTNEQLRLYVESGEKALPKIFQELDSAGISINSMSLDRPSLDDVFLRQTGHTINAEL